MGIIEVNPQKKIHARAEANSLLVTRLKPFQSTFRYHFAANFGNDARQDTNSCLFVHVVLINIETTIHSVLMMQYT